MDSNITVDPSGNWRMYTNTIPANSELLGTVTRDGYDTGALVRINATGAYVQVNAGAMRSLPGREVARALGILGQPPKADEDRASSHLHIRVTARQKAGWVKRAQVEGKKLSEWVADKLDK